MGTVLEQKSAVVEARVDVRQLATIAKGLLEHYRTIPRSKSELVRLGLEIAAGHVAHHTEPFESTIEALEYLNKLGLNKMNRSGRNARILMGQVQSEVDAKEVPEHVFGVPKTEIEKAAAAIEAKLHGADAANSGDEGD